MEKSFKEKNDKMIEARNKPRHKVGKQPMFRSQKPQKKKKKETKVIDPDRLAMLMYLGDLEADTTAGAAAGGEK